MINIAISDILKNWKHTLISSVLIGLILTLGISTVSTYEKVVEKYKPFKNLLSQQGYMYSVDCSGTHKTYDQAIYDIIKAKEAYSTLKVSGNEQSHAIILNEQKNMIEYDMYGYNEIISNYRPEMSEGVWYLDAQKKNNQIEVVVTPNSIDLGVGDSFSINGFKNVTFHVCGVTANEINYFKTSKLMRNSSVFDYFSVYSAGRQNDMKIFTSYDQLLTAGANMTGYTELAVFVTLDNVANKTNEVDGQGTFSEWDSFEILKKNSRQIIKDKMNEIVPLFGAIIFLSFISIICVAAINTTLELKEYAIYYINGMKWRGIVWINIIKSGLQSLLGLGFMAGIKSLIISKVGEENFLFTFGVEQIICVIAIIVLVVISSIIMPLIIAKTKSPVNVLRTSKMM